MRSLYFRIYLTVVAALALFALVSGWLLQNHLENERARFEGVLNERYAAWGDLLERSLPGVDAPAAQQTTALREWAARLRLPMALYTADGKRIGASEAYLRREAEGTLPGREQTTTLDDGRVLHFARPLMPHHMRRITPRAAQGAPNDADRPDGADGPDRPDRPGGPGDPHAHARDAPDGPGDHVPPRLAHIPPPFWTPMGLSDGFGLVALLVVLFAAVAAGALPVVRRLTRRLEALKRGVEAFGGGRLQERVSEDGRDEVAALGASFNRAASRIEALLRSHQSLLANASHELRSPLARLRMAMSMIDDAAPAQRESLRHEVDTNIAELDALVEEVLLASRLDASATLNLDEAVNLLALAAEEGAHVNATVEGADLQVRGDERLLRRALRNLLENAHRYGGEDIDVSVARNGRQIEVQVADHGPGVPAAFRERIFEPFFRLPGHAEREGGVGLGLALVRQIAERHGGSVRCEPRDGGGSRFTLALPG